MPTAGIKVLFIGKYFPVPYSIKHVEDSAQILGSIAQFQPDVVVTSTFMPGVLNTCPFEVRKRWIHVDVNAAPDAVSQAIENCYSFNLWTKHQYQDDNPLVSVYTGTYNTGDYLRDTYQSLKEQTYVNWEWVVVDDHSSDQTWEKLEALAKEDIRVRPFKSGKRLEKIGLVKDIATRLCRGEFLVELDHDDMLTDFALAEIKKAFIENPNVGMVYSNCSNIFENGEFHRFTDDFWKSRYRETEYRGKKYVECLQPDIYERFGRHFTEQFGYFLTVGPNHVRSFRAKTLFELGGYNPNLIVADDWDLYARFFLRSQCLLVEKMLYIYRFKDGWANTTFTRNKSIQDHLALGRNHYASEFSAFNAKRLKEEPPKEAKEAKEVQKDPAEKPTLKHVSFVVIEAVETPLTHRCIESIRKHAPESEVVLIANGIPATAKADVVIEFDANLGFAAAANAGADAATRRILCFMNNDAAFVDDSPEKLLAAMSETHPITAPYSNRAKPPQGDVSREQVPQGDVTPSMVVGLCMMVSKGLFQSLGGFDTDLLTYEDDEFCAKAARFGRLCKVVGGTWVEHERHETFRKLGLDVNQVMAKNGEIFRKKNPVIRVIVIAKDEEKALPEFFLQWLTVTRDWCVLDTGSKDKTVEIALKMGCKVEHAPFEDFASARNEAVKRFGEGADWIIMIDPDERMDLHTIRYLREFLYRTDSDILYSPLEARYPDGSIRPFVAKPFAWRNVPGIRWTFKVHEKLIGSRKQVIVKNAMNTHLLELHDDGRRQAASGFYDTLMKAEPYFTDPKYKASILKEWPILDYDRTEDKRIEPVWIGPLVSVIIPTFKRYDLLKQAVFSALDQDYPNLEVVVVGDACPEIRKKKPEFGYKVRLINLKHNHGAGGAVPRNHGLAYAGGPLVAYLDDDNTWKKSHVSSLYMALSSEQASFAFSSMEVDETDLGFVEPKQGNIDTSCILHLKSLVSKYGFWKNRTEANYYHDWEFVSRWVEGGEKWIATKRPTLVYNAETCGQKEFLKSLVAAKSKED